MFQRSVGPSIASHIGHVLNPRIVLVSLAMLVAACQTTVPITQVEETVETVAVMVSPSSGDSPDLQGQTVSGTIVVGIAAEGWMRDVRFFLNGALLRTLTAAPFEVSIDTTALADGMHSVGIEARMASNRVRVSQLVEFTVHNALADDASEGAQDPASDPEDAEDPLTNPGDSDDPATNPGDTEDPPATPEGAERSLTLRGDQNFSRNQLSAEQRVRYDRLWAELNDPANRSQIMSNADSDDLFLYGRALQYHLQPVLTAFRVTGDLALLDYVDEVTQRMRAQLDYGWRDTKDGTDGRYGEYLMWVYRNTSSNYGKDRKIDALKTAGFVAMVAYALEVNRDLASPSGRNYAAHADFWKHWLIDHFEAEWRERSRKATGFPINAHPDAHTYYTWTKWHYYMGLLTGKSGYTAEAHRMADIIWNDIRTVNVMGGPAHVWTSNITALSSDRNYLMTTSYASSVYGDVVTFHLEGFHRWAEVETVQAFARTVTQLAFDTDDPSRYGIAADIGGGEDQAGIPSDSGRPRRTASAFAGYQYALIGSWDPTGQIIGVSHQIQEALSANDTARLAAGIFVSGHLQPVLTAAATGTAVTTAAH